MQELGEKPKILQKHQREPRFISGLWVTSEFSGDDGDLRRVFRRLQHPDESNCYSSLDSDAYMALLLAHLTTLSEFQRFITWRKIDSGKLKRNRRDRPQPPPPRSHLPHLVPHCCIFRPRAPPHILAPCLSLQSLALRSGNF